jgi:hypothetical protein
MKILFLAVLLAVMQTLAPIPKKTANNAAQSGNSINKHTDDDRNPSATSSSPIVRQLLTSQRDQNTGSQPTPKDTQQSVRITELPPVTWWDRAYCFFGGLLVVVGFLQWWILHSTHKIMDRQAQIMQKQGEFIAVQNRAWIVLSFIETPHNTQIVKNTGHIRTGFGFNWSVKNCGNSPAFITRIGARWHPIRSLDELPAEPDIEASDLIQATSHYPHGLSIAPGDGIDRYTISRKYPTWPQESESDLIYMAYGIIEYKTAFSDSEIRETRFCYRYTPGAEESFLRSDVPIGYTKQT